MAQYLVNISHFVSKCLLDIHLILLGLLAIIFLRMGKK